MINIEIFTFNAFGENTYLLYDESKECVIIDPGCYDAHEQLELENFISSNDLNVVRLINTHCHIDHVLGVEFVKRKYNVGLETTVGEQEVLKAVETYADVYGFPKFEKTTVDQFLADGDVVSFGNGSKLKVISAPGHSPDHVVFYCEAQQFMIGGDVLFNQSIGRTDLPGGDFDTLIKSIHTRLFTLSDDIEVFPGHGPSTTIGFEKKNNPFCSL